MSAVEHTKHTSINIAGLFVLFKKAKSLRNLAPRLFNPLTSEIAQCLAEYVGKPLNEGVPKLDFSSKAMQTKYEMRTSSPATKKLILETAFSIEELQLDRKHWEEQYEKGNIKEGDWNAFAYEVAVHLAKNKYK